MLIAPFNDLDAVAVRSCAEHGHEIAAIIVEPLQRIIPPAPGFLQACARSATGTIVLLIFDEIVTGFRFAYGGAQERLRRDARHLHARQDHRRRLCAGRHRRLVPTSWRTSTRRRCGEDGWLMQLGTLSGATQCAAVAGLKTMEVLRRDGQYDRLKSNGERLMASFSKHLTAAGHDHQIVGEPWLFDVLFTPRPVKDYRDVMQADAAKNARFNTALRAHGVFKSPGKVYPSLALGEADLAQVDEAIARAAAAL
jgi:glutamate-1-semialdehyde 2,1-aminomutase